MALADVLAAPVVRPVYVGFLDIQDAPIRGWTGIGAFMPTETGDPDLDDEAFLEIEAPMDISPIRFDQGIGGEVTLSFPAAEMDEGPLVDELIQDRRNFLGRKAKFWLFFMNEDESAVLPDYRVLFNGVMTAASSTRQPGQPAMISITCDQDLQKAQFSPVRWIDHQFFYPDDTASTFINALTRGGITSANAPSHVQSSVAPPRGHLR